MTSTSGSGERARGPATARRAGRPPRTAPPEHRHRRGDRAARRRCRPGRAPARRALPATTPTPARSRRWQRAAVLIRHRRGRPRAPRHEGVITTVSPTPGRPAAGARSHRRRQRLHGSSPNPIKSRDAQDPVPILVAGLLARSDLEAGIEALLRSWPGTGLSSNGTGQWR